VNISQIRKQEEMRVKMGMRFLPDSPEQIAESMERLGPLRGQLYEVFQEAIGRVNKGQQEVKPAGYLRN
jgi:hypothetical protein